MQYARRQSPWRGSLEAVLVRTYECEVWRGPTTSLALVDEPLVPFWLLIKRTLGILCEDFMRRLIYAEVEVF